MGIKRGIMKFPYFKFLLIAGAMFLAWNCSDESSLPLSTDQNTVSEEVKVLKTEKGTVYITEDNEVKDEDGNIIGEYDPKKKKVTTDDGDVYDNVDKGDLDDGELKYSSASNEANSSSSKKSNNQTSSATNQNTDGKCFDAPSGKYVNPNESLRGPKNESYAYDEQCNLKCYWSEDNNTCSGVKNATPPSSNSNSSSSSKKQQTQSSASQQSGSCPNIVYKSGGHTGSGWATRYWDGCKPSCSWPENASKNGGIGTLTKQCDKNGKSPISGSNTVSTCDGGNASTCISQIPFTINGCDNMGFAFAAAPAADGAACGRCFELTFTGKGHWETKANHQALKDKKLIIMVSNVGWDVQAGQFDIMIPGGGLGNFDGTAGYGWGNLGARSGGLLTDCENSVGWEGDLLTKRKECLVQKCNSTFANDSEAKQGCLFLANYMQAAGNPEHNYKEIECPSVLSSKY